MKARYLNIDQLIEEVLPCYSKGALYKLAQRREIPHKKVGKKLVFRVDEVVRWAEGYNVNTFNEWPERG